MFAVSKYSKVREQRQVARTVRVFFMPKHSHKVCGVQPREVVVMTISALLLRSLDIGKWTPYFYLSASQKSKLCYKTQKVKVSLTMAS